MKRNVIFFIIISFLFLYNIKVFAAPNKITVSTTGKIWDFGYDNPYFFEKETQDGTAVYCAEFYKSIPSNCSIDNNWNSNSYYSAAIAHIMRDTKLNYGEKEILINYFLEKEGFTYSCPNNDVCEYVNFFGTRGKDGYSYIYLSGDVKTNAYSDYQEIKTYLDNILTGNKNKTGSAVMSNSSLKYDIKKNKYTGVLKVYNMGKYNSDYDVTFKYNGSKYNDCKVENLKHWVETAAGEQRDDLNISCEFDSVNTNKEIEIIVTSKKMYSSARYNCGSNYQKVFIATTSKRTVSTKATVLPNHPPVCTENDPECQCITDFNNTNAAEDPYQRIHLYRFGGEYNDYAGKYTNLLNFKIKDAETACSVATCKHTSNIECLNSSAYSNDEFDENNLSCYDEVINFNYAVGYCYTDFSIVSPHFTTFNNGLSTLAGYPLFKDEESLAAKGLLNKKCYVYKTYGTNNSFKNGDSIQELSNVATSNMLYKNDKEYKDYVKNVNLIYNKSNQIKEGESTPFDYEVKEYKSYYELQANSVMEYNFNRIYYNLLTGKVTSQQNDVNTNVDSGYYGIVSNFNDVTDSGILEFKYTYTPSSAKKDQITQQAICNYQTTHNPLIPPPSYNNLDIEFRTITTSNPFSGRSGKTRNVGSNWCVSNADGIIVSCSGLSSENSTIANYITNSNNSYNQTGDGPKYTITLTPSIIKEIRDYNKETSYDDFKFTCDNEGNNCKSDFLKHYGFTKK